MLCRIAAVTAIAAIALGPSPDVAATASGSGPANLDSPRVGIRLVDAPAQRRSDPRARLYIVDHVAPGATIRRRVEISNATSARRQISVYSAAAATRNGVFSVANGRAGNELTSWITLDKSALAIPPGGRRLVRMAINVPKSAAPGERYAVVWAEVASSPPRGTGVTVVNRVGVRIYLSVGHGGEPHSDFRIDSLTATRTTGGQPVVKARVRNTGGRALDLSGTLVLSHGPGGLRAGPFPAKVGTTLALRDAQPVVVPLDKRLPDGPWRVRMHLESGFVKRAAEATLIFPRHVGDSRPAPAKPTNGGFGLRILALCALLSVPALTSYLIWRHRHAALPRHRDGGGASSV